MELIEKRGFPLWYTDYKSFSLVYKQNSIDYTDEIALINLILNCSICDDMSKPKKEIDQIINHGFVYINIVLILTVIYAGWMYS